MKNQEKLWDFGEKWGIFLFLIFIGVKILIIFG